MAGDHKCPVCSSTFTRPQHVARHMRSHTGDRPYKCQHCGDQFARSDLLSRHVNKCHASEKPATTTQPKRRGHAAPGSSATGVRGPAPPLIPPPGTRKICDSCATSRTPAQCDSGLPCGKCLQRNSKCSYIKAEAAAARQPGLAVAPELFAPPTTVPSMAPPRADLYPPSQASFNFSVPAAAALYSSTGSALDPAAAPSSYGYDPSGNQGLSALQSSSAFTQYANHPLHHHQSTASSSYASQQAAAAAGSLADARKSALDAYLDSAFPPPSHQAVPGSSSSSAYGAGAGAGAGGPGGVYAGGNGVSGLNHAGSAHASQQQQLQPPPAPVMPVHTQIDFASFARQRRQAQQQQQHDSTQGSPQQQGSPVQNSSSNLGDPGVSNAFGLMSLDDPALSSEMSKGNSFFAPGALPTGFSTGLTPRKDRNDFLGMFPSSSVAAASNTTQPATTIGPATASLLTPGLGLGLSSASGGGLFGLGGTGLTPALNATSSLFGPGGSFGLNTPTPGKDANIAELKDFWKAFMKTPGEKTPGAGMLGGGGSGAEENRSNTGGIGNHRPLGKMASLPDIKTPGGGSALGHLQGQGQKDAATKQNFGGNEDLRSYEMAVLARQAPNLRLVPPKRRAGSMSMHPPSQSGYHHHQHSGNNAVSPPSLDSNASSPTSNASGSSGTPAPVSRLVRSDRPSFKRLASSTLQPFESKSVKTSHHGLADGEEDGEAEWADGVEDMQHQHQQQVQRHGGGGTTDGKGHVRSPSSEYPPGYQSQQSHGRRMSAPSGTAPVVI